jgi:indolepyruvate decarboxylase
LHHKVKDFRTQFEVFRRLCVAATDLSDPSTACRDIDAVLDAVVRYRRPGYIEIPRDIVNLVPTISYPSAPTQTESDAGALVEALAEAVRRISAAQRPVILADVEIHRFGLQERLLALAESAGIPIATTILGKSVISEVHPLFAGIYEGAMGREEVTQFVEQSDCVILLGAFMTDINMGIYTANLDPSRCIYATSEALRISHHHFRGVMLGDFIDGLIGADLHAPARKVPPLPSADATASCPEAPVTINWLIARLNHTLDESTVVIADVGDSLFASSQLVIRRQTEFISPAYYASMGFAVPAALGVMVARPEVRPLVLVGDGAFQMTGMELSNIVRRKLNPIVIVLNNGGYGTERQLHAGDHAFNEIHSWQYHRLPEVLGGGCGYEVRTQGEFDAALSAALSDVANMALVHVHLDRHDCSRVLERLGRRLGPKV